MTYRTGPKYKWLKTARQIELSEKVDAALWSCLGRGEQVAFSKNQLFLAPNDVFDSEFFGPLLNESGLVRGDELEAFPYTLEPAISISFGYDVAVCSSYVGLKICQAASGHSYVFEVGDATEPFDRLLGGFEQGSHLLHTEFLKEFALSNGQIVDRAPFLVSAPSGVSCEGIWPNELSVELLANWFEAVDAGSGEIWRELEKRTDATGLIRASAASILEILKHLKGRSPLHGDMPDQIFRLIADYEGQNPPIDVSKATGIPTGMALRAKSAQREAELSQFVAGLSTDFSEPGLLRSDAQAELDAFLNDRIKIELTRAVLSKGRT